MTRPTQNQRQLQIQIQRQWQWQWQIPFREHLQRAIFENCDLWHNCSEWWENITWAKKRQRQWKKMNLENTFKEQFLRLETFQTFPMGRLPICNQAKLPDHQTYPLKTKQMAENVKSCKLLAVEETQWSRELERCESLKRHNPFFNDCWSLGRRWVLPRSVSSKAESWFSVRGEGLSAIQGFCEFPTTTTDDEILHCSRFWILCIDKTHRQSHGPRSGSALTFNFFFASLYCVNITKHHYCLIFSRASSCLVTIGWIARWTQRLFVSPHQIRHTRYSATVNTLQTKSQIHPWCSVDFIYD